MTSIPIERLRSPTLIHHKGGDFGTYGDFAEVQDVEFDGHEYIITARFLESDGARDWVGGTEVRFTVEPGSTVTYGGRSAPLLRDVREIGDDERAAKAEAMNAPVTLQAATASFCDMLVARNAPGADRLEAAE
tara:strand:+ start:5358 stop:5756 length:399 start_codon:yes stop_codon:yes gene_type:complete